MTRAMYHVENPEIALLVGEAIVKAANDALSKNKTQS